MRLPVWLSGSTLQPTTTPFSRRVVPLGHLAEDRGHLGHDVALLHPIGDIGQDAQNASFVAVHPVRAIAQDRLLDRAQQGALLHVEVMQDIADADQAVLDHSALKDVWIPQLHRDRFDARSLGSTAQRAVVGLVGDDDLRVLQLGQAGRLLTTHVGADIERVDATKAGCVADRDGSRNA